MGTASLSSPELGSPLSSAHRRSKKQRASGETESSEPSQPLPAVLPRAAAVVLRAPDRDQHASISAGGLALTSSRGYRSVQATHGVHAGAWYYEVQVRHLGPSGAARIGWATAAAEHQGPVGGDRFGYAYRSMEGVKVHKGVREPYGAPWEEGAVIGCLIYLPRPEQRQARDQVDHPATAPSDHAASASAPDAATGFVGFFKDGVWQGKAFLDPAPGVYRPSISLYTNPLQQAEPARVSVNFGATPFAVGSSAEVLQEASGSPVPVQAIAALVAQPTVSVATAPVVVTIPPQ